MDDYFDKLGLVGEGTYGQVFKTTKKGGCDEPLAPVLYCGDACHKHVCPIKLTFAPHCLQGPVGLLRTQVHDCHVSWSAGRIVDLNLPRDRTVARAQARERH